ncbi:MAG TPA: OmpH family outer membrane protein [Pyrinomonadaceae bacterium]|nr:OmpH family outer membrane protein [Pyrinomonadaceae bacterium]
MKVVSSIFSVFVLSLVFAAAASAQTQAKYGFINTVLFSDDKGGITKLVNANKQVDALFAARVKELQDGQTRLQTIARDLENMQKLPQNQFNPTAYSNKQEEGERLQRDLKYKDDDLKRDYPKKRDEIVGPISIDIGKALDEYATKNGFTAVFDVAKLVDSGSLLTLAPAADITKDFITFYNARPTPAAAPK